MLGGNDIYRQVPKHINYQAPAFKNVPSLFSSSEKIEENRQKFETISEKSYLISIPNSSLMPFYVPLESSHADDSNDISIG